MIQIAIVDDEEIILHAFHDKIRDILSEKTENFEISNFSDGKDFLERCLLNNYDIIFLDIDMPEITGIDIAKAIRKYNVSSEIIFITNKDEMVYASLRYAPFRFIRKVKFEDEIQEATESVLHKIAKKSEVFLFSTISGKRKEYVTNILYIEVKSHILTIHTQEAQFEARGNLKDIESRLVQFGFIRIHQSYLVNYKYINLVKQKVVVLDSGIELPLSRGRSEEVKKKLIFFSREMDL